MFHRKSVSQDPVVVLLFPGTIQWVWEKPCPYTPPEGMDCVFMERAYLTQQVPDRLWRFFFFFWQGNLPEFPRNTIPGWGTLRTAQVYFTLCKKWEWMAACGIVHSAPLCKVQVCHNLCWSFKATLSGTAKWMSTSLKRTLCGLSAFNSRIRTEMTVSL